MKKTYATAILVIGILFSSTPVFASNYPSYSYIQATAQSWELPDLELKNITGPGVRFSIELGDTFFVTGEAFQISKEGSEGAYSIKDEFEVGGIGMGIKSSTVNKTSWFLALTHEKWTWDTSVTLPGLTIMDTIKPERTNLIIGFRSQLSKSFEVNGSIQHYDIDFKNGDEFEPSNTEKGNAIQLGLTYQFIEDFHLILDYSRSESNMEYNRTSLGLRYSF